MVNNKKYSTGMTNGNVAYEIQPQIDIKKKQVKKPVKKAKSNVKVKLKIMGMVVAIAMFSFLTLCRYATINSMSKDVRESKIEIKKMQMENENIAVKIANKDNIKKVEKVATSKYGMVIPQKTDIVYFEAKGLTASEAEPKQTAFQVIQRMLGLIY